MQTVELETYDQGSQCQAAVTLPVAVQTSYSFALLAPELWVEEVVPALQPSVAIRWKAPTAQVRQVVTEYQLTVSECGCGAPCRCRLNIGWIGSKVWTKRPKTGCFHMLSWMFGVQRKEHCAVLRSGAGYGWSC